MTRWCGDDACGAELQEGRSDARFCSSACRQRSYRRRKVLLGPYGGDAEAALAESLRGLSEIIGRRGRVTDTSRNGDDEC